MTSPIFVTKTVKRESQYRGGFTLELSPFDLEGHFEWFEKRYKKTRFTIPKPRFRGEQLFYELCNSIQQRNCENIERIIKELEKICIKSYDEKNEAEKWGDMAVQLPNDWGPIGENKNKLKEIITGRSSGYVLDAMCGFNSYFGNSDNITEVVSLDFCEEALERHEYPERKRILYNLERVVNGERMDFFNDSSFQTIGIFFGINYLTNPVAVYNEFDRILSKVGKLLIVGGTAHGYTDLSKRKFNPKECSIDLKSAGFSVKVESLPLKTEHELGEYFLVEGKR